MTQNERRIFLIKTLLSENIEYQQMEIPSDVQQQKRLLRALFNVRMPKPISQDFLTVQDAYLQEETRRKGITDFADLTPLQEKIYLRQMTAKNPKATYACINRGEALCPREIERQSICMDADIGEVINQLEEM